MQNQIFWLSSYPKSGNTWLRTLISAYYYSKDGKFTQNLIKNIGQFPEKRHFEGFLYDVKSVVGTTDFWIKAQERINKEKKLNFFKTHNVFGKINDKPFTNKENSLGCIYIVRDPRNVLTSLMNHYSLTEGEALSMINSVYRNLRDENNLEDYLPYKHL